MFDVTSSANPITACRQRCNDAGHALAFVRQTTDCRCADVMPENVTACGGGGGSGGSGGGSGDWGVYRVHHVITTQHALRLRAWSQRTTGRDYTKPGEDVALYASHHLDLDLAYTFAFDDGTTLVTSRPPVYHAFETAGSHEVTVTTAVGLISLNASVEVLIEDVDEGSQPALVAVTSWHEETKARTALNEVFVAEEHSTNCSLSYGDGRGGGGGGGGVTLPTFEVFGGKRRTEHLYAVCGRYRVEAECRNAYGLTREDLFFLARERDTFSAHRRLGEGFSISVAGQPDFLKVMVGMDCVDKLADEKKVII